MAEHQQVAVVGAGLAGLACAATLAEAGVEVVVLEASDGVGGRVRTDAVDGLLLDRGFQLLNPSYPALKGFVDLDALDLRPFDAGVVVQTGGERHVLADPRRQPSDVGSALSAATGSALEKARFGSYLLKTALLSGDRVKARRDEPYGVALRGAGVSGRLRTSVLEPFLAGVLAEDRQESSRVFVDLLLRSFARGTPSLPARGMQALPDQLAARLPSGAVRLNTEVAEATGRQVVADGYEIAADAVVIAADPAAGSRLAGIDPPTMRALTTYYHRAPTSPAARRLLHVDGDRSGPIVNTAVVSDVAPGYCATGALVASTVLGAHDDAETAQAVTAQLGRVYGVDPSGWELVAVYPIPEALPAMLPPLNLRQQVDLGDGLFVAGDHRDTASIQGALVSGRRTAAAVLARLGAAAA